MGMAVRRTEFETNGSLQTAVAAVSAAALAPAAIFVAALHSATMLGSAPVAHKAFSSTEFRNRKKNVEINK